jgi:hypothetical protein
MTHQCQGEGFIGGNLKTDSCFKPSLSLKAMTQANFAGGVFSFEISHLMCSLFS